LFHHEELPIVVFYDVHVQVPAIGSHACVNHGLNINKIDRDQFKRLSTEVGFLMKVFEIIEIFDTAGIFVEGCLP
jgi:hypothetical protein